MAIGLFSSVHASEWGDCVQSGDVATIQCLEPIFGRVVQATLALSGIALFTMLVVGGYHFLLSGGDQKKLEMAKGTLTNAIIGLVLIVTAFLIVKTVSIFTGVPAVTQFTVPMWQ